MSSSTVPSAGVPAAGAAAGGAPAHPAPAAHAPKFDTVTFVLHIDYFIFAVFVFFALFTIPRLFIRYSRKSEWGLGYLLRAVPLTGPGERWTRDAPVTSDVADSKFYNVSTADHGSSDSHTLYSHATLVQNEEKFRQATLPPRSRSISSFLHPVAAALGHPIMPGYSIGKLLIMLGYFSVILYASIYKSSPFSDPQRTGFVAMSQLPIVFALGTKNNIFGMILSVGYEKVQYLLFDSTHLLTQPI